MSDQTWTDPCSGVRYRYVDGRFEWTNDREEPGVWAAATDRPDKVTALYGLIVGALYGLIPTTRDA